LHSERTDWILQGKRIAFGSEQTEGSWSVPLSEMPSACTFLRLGAIKLLCFCENAADTPESRGIHSDNEMPHLFSGSQQPISSPGHPWLISPTQKHFYCHSICVLLHEAFRLHKDARGQICIVEGSSELGRTPQGDT